MQKKLMKMFNKKMWEKYTKQFENAFRNSSEFEYHCIFGSQIFPLPKKIIENLFPDWMSNKHVIEFSIFNISE